MNAVANEALKASIAKWEARLDGVYRAPTITGCPLCAVYYSMVRDGERCEGCPVFLHTGRMGCSGTPVDDYGALCNRGGTAEGRADLIAAAAAEVAFLKSLITGEATDV